MKQLSLLAISSFILFSSFQNIVPTSDFFEKTISDSTITITDTLKTPLDKDLEFNIKGKVIDEKTKLPLVNVNVYLGNDCDEEVQEYKTNKDGVFSFYNVSKDCCFFLKAIVKTNSHLSEGKDKICTRGQVSAKDFEYTLSLTPARIIGCGVGPLEIDLQYNIIIKDENNQPVPNLRLNLKNFNLDRKVYAQTNVKGEISLYFKRPQDCFKISLNDNQYQITSEEKALFFCPHNDAKGEKNVVQRTILVAKQ